MWEQTGLQLRKLMMLFMQNKKDMTLKELAQDSETVEDIQEALKGLFKDTLQQVFEAEMEEHLGYNKHNTKGNNTGNSRNGYSEKTIQTRFGNSKVKIPRNRNGVGYTRRVTPKRFCDLEAPCFSW